MQARRPRLQPVPVKPAELALRGLELLRVSPLAEWHYKTAHRDSFVDVSRAKQILGWQPRLLERGGADARRTTGTSRTAAESAPPVSRTAFPGTSRPSAC